MSDSEFKIEIHLIQNFAPSNLNRDETGQPKSVIFGGVRRARISSQCSKRSVRQRWKKCGTLAVGVRTRHLKAELGRRIQGERRSHEQIDVAVGTFLAQFYSKMDGDKTAVILLVSQDELSTAESLIKENWGQLSLGRTLKGKDMKVVVAEIDRARTSADIALFGRMLVGVPTSNTDGSCQVAHPISTHKVDMDLDFYTAVDELSPSEEAGAGMMGTIGFNSACYYRYALVDRDQLARNLTRKTGRVSADWTEELNASDYKEADSVMQAFLEAMIYAIPTGKQNSFAAQNLPSFGMFVVRRGGVPISLANAFAKPIRPTSDDDDLVGLSVAALARHWYDLRAVYGDQGVICTPCFHIEQKSRLNNLAESDHGSVANAINAVFRAMRQ